MILVAGGTGGLGTGLVGPLTDPRAGLPAPDGATPDSSVEVAAPRISR